MSFIARRVVLLCVPLFAAACSPPADPPSSSPAGGSGGGSPATSAGGSGGAPAGGTSTGGQPGGTGAGGASGAGPAGTGGRGTPGAGTGGTTGTGGRAPIDARSGSADSGTDATPPPAMNPGGGEKFSFFYTSLAAMRRLSKSQNGFGGDLRFGAATGLEGADKICQTIAADVSAGAGAKQWRAFLSVTSGPGGQPVHAIDRVGEGPWYDRLGRLVAMNKAGLLAGDRPMGDPAVGADLPDETGMGTRRLGDTHDVVTGSNRMGRLRYPGIANTCQDWTSTTIRTTIGFGHAWPAGSGRHWIEVHTGRSCAASANLVQNGGGDGSGIGSGGGWGGIYCFALTP